MNKLLKFKYDKRLLIFLFIFIIISFVSIYSAETLLNEKNNFLIKQITWYIVGFGLIFIIILLGNDFFYKYSLYLYIIGNILLLLLLIFGTPINDAKCWFTIPYIGTLQPSEFMKIALIIMLAKMINDFHEKNKKITLKKEFIFLIKTIIIVLIPSLLTFLEPDTGVVLIYLLIAVIMLFVSGIRYRWFIILFSLIGLFIFTVLFIYTTNNELFIDIFGTSFFLRVDRLLDWTNKSGYQLSNGIVAIASGGLFGHGFNNTPLYFPEPQTDFIFAVFASNFGLIGSIFLLIIIIMFNTRIISIAAKSKRNLNKYILSGIIGMLLYQQFQNIGMTFGLMPITGITLPLISYGGSSLLSYMIVIGIILNIYDENKKHSIECF